MQTKPQSPESDPAIRASQKLCSGTLLSLEELAALLDIAPATVHKLPLACVRIGRQYRFDPKDVQQFILQNKFDACDESGLPLKFP
jgi:hypothetical protein